ncbi:MAG TPA: hypothetical protein IAC25_02435 [Candidatus Enterenecus stercoripullorum]|nr:hypothetical protein [Candidatus Enterenecus stercoripullorum]
MLEMQLDTRELGELATRLDRAPEVIREARRQAMEQAAPKLQGLVTAEIGGTGKVQRWQQAYVGSWGGYAAVRPKAKTFAQDNRGKVTRYQVGAVTNAINAGHRFPSPSGRNRDYRPRIRSGQQRVPGRHFYESAQAKVPQVAQEAAQQMADALISHLEG